MSVEEEAAILAPFKERAEKGEMVEVSEIAKAYQSAVTHKVSDTQIYCVLHRDRKSRSSVEMADKKIRPEIAESNVRIEDYDEIFLGFPIWWYVAPTIINTFLEKYDFSGKKIILFATSGGSKFGKTVEELKVSVSADTEIIEGKLLNGKQSIASVKEWTDTLTV